MSTLVLRLLGPPEIEWDGVIVPPPRGHKAWAVLAYLVLTERPVSRTQLAALVFGDAEDPRGALRWTLAQLRRALGVAGGLGGDPVELALPPATVVDVLALAAGETEPALVRGELLEGVDPGAGPEFDAWLLVERRRLAGVCEAVLRDEALGALAAGHPLEAAALASRAVTLNRFDDGAHELLVRCLARAGQIGAAREHADACDVLFRRQLGRAPDPGVHRAAEEGDAQPVPAGGPGGGRGPARRGARRRGCRRGGARRGMPQAGLCRGAWRRRSGAAGACDRGARGGTGALGARR